ncbi:hypothetical protein J5N97_017331 [Dioscorea zingiberensis]|uniref:Uncharacterized protein n=1 Tax=Dioscorea zingiberensis TaxID=325984 RepID=A0A9D5CKZ4_9LILI|nr:hypothetical protein J5N97_017331 [Dioscorea zingiberensis]
MSLLGSKDHSSAVAAQSFIFSSDGGSDQGSHFDAKLAGAVEGIDGEALHVIGAETILNGGGAKSDLSDENSRERLLDGDADGDDLGEDYQVSEHKVGGYANGDKEKAGRDRAVLEEIGVIRGDAAVGVIVGKADEVTLGEGTRRPLR